MSIYDNYEKCSLKELQDISSLLSIEVVKIQAQIEESQINFHEYAIPINSEWLVKAKYAMRMKNIEIGNLKKLIKLKSEELLRQKQQESQEFLKQERIARQKERIARQKEHQISMEELQRKKAEKIEKKEKKMRTFERAFVDKAKIILSTDDFNKIRESVYYDDIGF